MKKALSAALMLATTVVLGGAMASDRYDLSATAAAAKVNTHAVAKVSVAPKGAYHMNLQFPVSLKVTAPDGVKLDKDKLTKDDAKRFDKAGLDFEIGFTAASAGKKTLTGELRFAVCTDTDCQPQKESVTITVDVK